MSNQYLVYNMCYRYSVPGPDSLVKRFSALFLEPVPFKRQYHASSFDLPKLPVITNENPKQIQLFTWGLIPFWARDSRISYSTINARSEEIEVKPAFRKAFRQQRCLVPASGFFEWRKVSDRGKVLKIPYWIRLVERRVFGFAGIFDIWKDAQGFEIKTFSIVTTKANKIMMEIHDRMPVILNIEDEEDWLNNKFFDMGRLKKIMEPNITDNMEAYRVADLVNNPGNNNCGVIEKSQQDKY